MQASVTAVNEKADRINESVTKNTRDIGTLSDNVTMQGNAINSINTEKIPSIENNVSELTTKVSANTASINELTTKVDTNTDSISKLTTKVNTNTDSINTINNTSIPHLQSEIDNLSGGGTGSVGELREKVEKNTADISTLSGKVDTNTTVISTINDTSIPNLQSEIDNIKGSGTGSIGELKTKVEKNTADISTLSGKVDTNTTVISTINDTSIPNLQSEIDNIKGSGTGSIGELKTKVEKNTSDISALARDVETNTTDISNIKDHSWTTIIDQSSNGMQVKISKSNTLPLAELYATLTFPQSTEGSSITMRISGGKEYAPYHLTTAPVYLEHHYATASGYLYAMFEGNDLIVGFTLSGKEMSGTGIATLLYRY